MFMKQIFTTFVLIFVLSGCGNNSEINLWGKAFHGATEAQIKEIYPESISSAEDSKDDFSGKLKFNNYEIDGDKFEVIFFFDKQGGLAQVGLTPANESKLTETKFTSFKDGLLVKYGKALEENKPKSSFIKEYQGKWVTDEKVIVQVNYNVYDKDDYGYLYIIYYLPESASKI